MPKYHVDRTTEINASPVRVYDVVADYQTWSTWSPWLIAEPDADVKVTENSNSVGSVYSWSGQVTGQGEVEHKRLDPGQLVDDEIRFFRPFKSVSQVSFEIEPTENGSKITWNMDGSLPWFMFWMRAMMESLIGMDYERGLRMLKEWIETGAIQSHTDIRGVQPVDARTVVGVRDKCAVSGIGPAMTKAFTEAAPRMQAAGLPTDGEMISVYHSFCLKTQTVEFTSGYTVRPEVTTVPAGLSHWSVPATQAFCVEHIGRYDHLGNAWSAANQHVRYKKLKQSKVGTFEIYRNNPDSTPAAELRTEIYLPLK